MKKSGWLKAIALSTALFTAYSAWSTQPLLPCSALLSLAPAFNPETRFIEGAVVEKAYRAKPRSFVSREGETITVGIVNPSDPDIALRISNVLTRSIDMARANKGGHIPEAVVDRLQATIASAAGVQVNWSERGYRLLVTRAAANRPNFVEVLGTIVVTQDHDTLFFLSGRHNNLQPVRKKSGEIDYYIDGNGERVTQSVVDRSIPSVLAPLAKYKPDGLYQIANFAFVPEARGGGLSKLVLETIMDLVESRAVDYRGQVLFPHGEGKGFWQIGEPPWQNRMRPMGFHADPTQHVYMTQPAAQTGDLTHLEFNESWGVLREYYVAMNLLLERGSDLKGTPLSLDLRSQYESLLRTPRMRQISRDFTLQKDELEKTRREIQSAGLAFPERIPTLYRLATNGESKLQYKILETTFEDVRKTIRSR